MIEPFSFTSPPDTVQQARLAMARLRARLALKVDPLAPCADQTSLALAFMALEDTYPAYPPLPDGIAGSRDARAELDDAIGLLQRAMREAEIAVDTLRIARAIRHIRELSDSPYLTSGPAGRRRPTGSA